MIFLAILLWWVGVGCSFLMGIRNPEERAEVFGRRWLKPKGRTKPEHTLQRAQLVLKAPVIASFTAYSTAWILVAAMVAMIVIGIVTNEIFLFALPFVGFLMSRFLVLGFYTPEFADQTLWYWLLSVASHHVVSSCKQQDALNFLDRLGNCRDFEIRLVAVEGFYEMGMTLGLPHLQNMMADRNEEVRQAARNALKMLKKVEGGISFEKLDRLQSRIDEYSFWGRQLSLSIFKKQQLRINQQSTSDEIDRIISSQAPLRWAYPDLYCGNCNARAERRFYEEWSWVQCKVCRKADQLDQGIKTVIAQIGGSVQRQIEGENLLIALWNPFTKTVLRADVDVLEIIGGQPIDYDWAVSAVVEKLHNENPDYGKAIRVVLVGQPALAANTVKLLRDLDPQFVDGK